MTSKILFVDDEPNLLAALERNLRRSFTFDTALGGQEALRMIAEHGPYAVVVADQNMPVMSGVVLLEQVRALAPDTVRMMLTGNADQQTAVDAVNRGQIFRFLNKPCAPEVLIPALQSALQHYQLLRTERELLEGTLTGSVKILSEILGLVAPAALGRGQRLRAAMRAIAPVAGADPLWELEIAAVLSPIGYAALPLHVLRQLDTGGELSRAEASLLRGVPQIGHDLLAGIPRLGGVAKIIRYQDKNFCGTGFPSDETRGEDIPIGARLLKILTDRLALEQDGIVKRQAYEAMNAKTGVYDPRLLRVCFEVCADFLTQTISASAPVLSLRIDQLTAGQIVVSDIETTNGTVLMTAGTQITPMIMARLQSHASLQPLREPFLVQNPSLPTLPASDTSATAARAAAPMPAIA